MPLDPKSVISKLDIKLYTLIPVEGVEEPPTP
jgi:hypothetical protein